MKQLDDVKAVIFDLGWNPGGFHVDVGNDRY